MPMIRVDDEVYRYLNEQGRTEDTFNDVIRRELELPPRKPRRSRDRGSVELPQYSEPMSNEASTLVAALDKHLPPHWSETPARRQQIFDVVRLYLRTPRDWPVADRHLHACKLIAQEREVTIQTIEDKCGRQLYGEGQLMMRFRSALEAVEAELEG